MKRIISLFVLCFIIISVFCGCSLIVPQLERLDDDHDSSVVAGEWQVDDIVFDIEGYTAVDDDALLQFSMLGNEDRELYEVINDAIINGVNKLDVEGEGYSIETVEKVFSLVKADHPEYFYVTDDFEYKYYVGETDVTIILIKYTDGKTVDAFNDEGGLVRCADRELIAERVNDFRSRIQTILDTVPADATDLELEKFIHDYLVDNIEYYNGTISFDAVPLPDYMNVYGGLTEKIGICQTYTKLMQYLCLQVGVNASQISGFSADGEAHMWNVVEIDDMWYHLDVTWDDPVIAEDNGESYRYYNYFNLTEDEILKDHIVDDDYNYLPACTSYIHRPEETFFVKFTGYNSVPENYKLMADSIDDGSEDYVYIYMGDNEVNSEYLSRYFFESDSPFNEYLNDRGYRFTLSNQYFYSNKYCFIPIVR